jgi:hypothetical protein
MELRSRQVRGVVRGAHVPSSAGNYNKQEQWSHERGGEQTYRRGRREGNTHTLRSKKRATTKNNWLRAEAR